MPLVFMSCDEFEKGYQSTVSPQYTLFRFPFIYNAEDMLNYRWGWKTERNPLSKRDYFVLIYNIYRLPPDICCRFVIRGTFYYLVINSVNKFFILAIYAR